MRQWLVVWEVSINRYSEVRYMADSVATALGAWQAGHPNGDIRAIEKIELLEATR